MNNDPKHSQNDLDFGFGDSGWLGGSNYQESNEFGNNNFDDINTYDNNYFQQPANPDTQQTSQYQYTDNTGFQNGTSGMPFRDEYRDPFNSRETKELEQAVEAGTAPPLPPIEHKKMSFGLLFSFFAWLIITTAALTFSLFSGEVWVSLPYTIQIFSGMIVFFVAPPQKRARPFAAFIFIDILFIAGNITLRMLYPMFSLALSRHCAFHILEAVAFFTGLYFSFGKMFTGSKIKNNCTEPAQGRCLRVITDYIPDGRNNNISIYRPIYQYEYKGRHYESYDNDNPKLKAPKTNETKTLMVDPNNPTDFYVSEKITGYSIFFFFFGLALIAGSVIIFITEMAETLDLMIH